MGLRTSSTNSSSIFSPSIRHNNKRKPSKHSTCHLWLKYSMFRNQAPLASLASILRSNVHQRNPRVFTRPIASHHNPSLARPRPREAAHHPNNNPIHRSLQLLLNPSNGKVPLLNQMS